jgi:hypothetical protein
MSKYEDKTNNEILLDIKQMEIDYKVLKQKILNDFDKLLQMEKDCVEAINVRNKRLKGNI